MKIATLDLKLQHVTSGDTQSVVEWRSFASAGSVALSVPSLSCNAPEPSEIVKTNGCSCPRQHDSCPRRCVVDALLSSFSCFEKALACAVRVSLSCPFLCLSCSQAMDSTRV